MKYRSVLWFCLVGYAIIWIVYKMKIIIMI